MGEVSGGSLHHEFKGGVWLHIGEILFPQDGARAALDAEKLQDKQVTGSLLERQTEELILSMKTRTRALPDHTRGLRRFGTWGSGPSYLA